MNIKSIITFFMMINMFLLFISCEDASLQIPVEESIKTITGNWKVSQLIRNGEDLTKRLKTNNYTINFKEDGTYVVSNQLPFIVSGVGTYSLNDPQHPFSLILKPNDSASDIEVKFQFPVVNGKRQLSLSLSLGCTSNTYQYNFDRLNTGL